jgi:hypothetical protein
MPCNAIATARAVVKLDNETVAKLLFQSREKVMPLILKQVFGDDTNPVSYRTYTEWIVDNGLNIIVNEDGFELRGSQTLINRYKEPFEIACRQMGVMAINALVKAYAKRTGQIESVTTQNGKTVIRLEA